MARKLGLPGETIHFQTDYVDGERYELSEPGNIAQYFRFVWKDATYDTPDKIFMEGMESMMDFVAPLLEDDTLTLHKFRSPDWTWGALCGREGFVILDADGFVVDSDITCLS